MRESGDEIKDGVVFNGFDYELQVWVKDGIIQKCGHRYDIAGVNGMLKPGTCCNAGRYAGQEIKNIEGHQVR